MCVKLAVTWHQIKLNYCDVADLSPLVSDFSPDFKTYQQPQNQGRTVHVIRLFLSHTGSGFGSVNDRHGMFVSKIHLFNSSVFMCLCSSVLLPSYQK